MKYLCSIICFFFTTLPAFTQNQNLIGDVTPPIPNAASLGEYGEIEVGLHTGIPSVGVNMFTLQQGVGVEQISVPVALRYHSAGVKVSELSGHVGLGFSLQAGGVITRSVRNTPDEGYALVQEGYYSKSNENLNLPTNEWANAADGLHDTEPDVFFFNFNGKTTILVVTPPTRPRKIYTIILILLIGSYLLGVSISAIVIMKAKT